MSVSRSLSVLWLLSFGMLSIAFAVGSKLEILSCCIVHKVHSAICLVSGSYSQPLHEPCISKISAQSSRHQLYLSLFQTVFLVSLNVSATFRNKAPLPFFHHEQTRRCSAKAILGAQQAPASRRPSAWLARASRRPSAWLALAQPATVSLACPQSASIIGSGTVSVRTRRTGRSRNEVRFLCAMRPRSME